MFFFVERTMSHSGDENIVDMMEDEDVDMMEGGNVDRMEEGDVHMMEVEDPQPQTERRKRGSTMCLKTADKKDLQIEFRKDGSVTGPNRTAYSNWVNNLVKQRASILVESWDQFDKKTEKDEW